MAAFRFQDLDWSRPDVAAILNNGGIFSVLPADLNGLQTWLTADGYVAHQLDFGQSFRNVQRDLGSLLNWEGQFGYRLEDGTANLDALNDGFDFPAKAGSQTALCILNSDKLVDQRSWVIGFLSIAAQHSTYHLALGGRFITVLSMQSNSWLAGAHVSFSAVPPPHPLRLS